MHGWYGVELPAEQRQIIDARGATHSPKGATHKLAIKRSAFRLAVPDQLFMGGTLLGAMAFVGGP